MWYDRSDQRSAWRNEFTPLSNSINSSGNFTTMEEKNLWSKNGMFRFFICKRLIKGLFFRSCRIKILSEIYEKFSESIIFLSKDFLIRNIWFILFEPENFFLYLNDSYTPTNMRNNSRSTQFYVFSLYTNFLQMMSEESDRADHWFFVSPSSMGTVYQTVKVLPI